MINQIKNLINIVESSNIQNDKYYKYLITEEMFTPPTMQSRPGMSNTAKTGLAVGGTALAGTGIYASLSPEKQQEVQKVVKDVGSKINSLTNNVTNKLKTSIIEPAQQASEKYSILNFDPSKAPAQDITKKIDSLKNMLNNPDKFTADEIKQAQTAYIRDTSQLHVLASQNLYKGSDNYLKLDPKYQNLGGNDVRDMYTSFDKDPTGSSWFGKLSGKVAVAGDQAKDAVKSVGDMFKPGQSNIAAPAQAAAQAAQSKTDISNATVSNVAAGKAQTAAQNTLETKAQVAKDIVEKKGAVVGDLSKHTSNFASNLFQHHK